MDSADDDFVDDKAQATAAFAGEEPECAPISGENKGFEVTVEPESRGEMKKLDVVVVDKDSSPCVDACVVNRTEAKEESEYSDSDDDLNIVPKEDDSKPNPVACGSNTNNQRQSTGNWGRGRGGRGGFSIVPREVPPAFGMTVRLAPDMMEEIKRLEAQGGAAKIKFDALPNSTTGNIIDIGGKEFKFTWCREPGNLCDIYEEHQSGEDGNGVLVEAGCAWRKLNVQRTLDESTRSHLKMLSVEAEQRTKSRKLIVLDPATASPSPNKQLARAKAAPWRMSNKQKKEPPPKKRKVDPAPVAIGGPKPSFRPGASTTSVKNRSGQPLLAAPWRMSNKKEPPPKKRKVDPAPVAIGGPKPSFRPGPSTTSVKNRSGQPLLAAPWRMSNKQKKEPPPKKRKVDPAPVAIGGPKPSFRPGASTTSVKNRLSVSLGPSPSNQYNTLSYGTGNIAKSHADNLNVTPVKTRGRESMVASEKDLSTWESNALRNTSGRQETNVNEEIDLQALLVDLLKEAPRSFKALEKAVGNRTPNAAKWIEPILKKIANFQAPSYFLKPGADLESYKKHSIDSKSSPEHQQQLLQMTDCSRDQLPVPGVSNMENFSVCERNGEGSQDCLNVHLEEKLSAQENVDVENDLPGSLHEEKRSENTDGQARISNSESDSDNNDSGSDSGSSSDSEASSVSKEVSDEDMDIMSDGDKEQSAEQDAIDLPSAEIEGLKKKLPEVSVSHKSTHTVRDLQEAELQLLEERLQVERNSSKLFKNRAAYEEASRREFLAEEFGRLKLDIGSFNDRVNHLYEYFSGSVSASHKKRKKDLVVEPLVQFPAICEDSQPSERKYDLEHLNASSGQMIDPLKELQKSSTESLSRHGQMNPGDSSCKSNKHSGALGNVRGGNDNPDISEKLDKDQNRSSMESKRHKETTSMNGPKDATSKPGESVVQEKRMTSFEEEYSSYLKYEKASADPKGPISDHSQYKAYQQEYLDKYDDYCSVNKIVESYRNDFKRLGEGLVFAEKARDMEESNKIMQDLNESYSKYGEGHKRLKKVFIVLHEELKQLKERMADYASSAASERRNERLCIISPEKI